jgi:hypothetical protein
MSGIAFRNGGWQGERVVPFDGPRLAPWEQMEIMLTTPPTKASGWLKGLLMQERADRQRAYQRARGRPSTSKPAIEVVAHREPSERLRQAWAAVEQTIRAMVDGPTWDMWLADLHPRSFVGGIWTLATGPQQCGWVESRFGRLLTECAGCPVRIIACECNKAACAA